MKIIGKRFFLFVSSTLLALTAVEVAFRIHAHFENSGLLTPEFDTGVNIPASGEAKLGHLIRLSENPRIIYELKPNLRAIFSGAPITTNSRGFRGREVPTLRHQNSFRIVGVGDSVMFGKGVADVETYLSIVERGLRREFPEITIEAINTAVPGYNTVQEVETLKQKGLEFEPDLVIINFVGNDLFLPKFVRKKRNVLSLRHSFLRSFVTTRRKVARNQKVREELSTVGLERTMPFDQSGFVEHIDADQVPEAYRDLVGPGAYRQAMSELRDLADRYKFDVLTVSLGPKPISMKLEAFEISSKLGFHTVDLGPTFLSYMNQHGIEKFKGSVLSVGADDPHPSPLAHSMAADVILEYMLAEDLVTAHKTD